MLSTVERCGENSGEFCRWVSENTDSAWMSRIADIAVDRLIRVIAIAVVAFFVSWLLRLAVTRIGGRVARSRLTTFQSTSYRPRLLRNGDDEAERHSVAAASDRAVLRANTVVSVVASLVTVVVWFVAALLALERFGVSLAPLLAGAGVLGVALGFGAQSIVSDFLTGMFMLFEDQFGVGDVIDVGEASGTVEGFSLRTTTLRDVNGTVWHIRNSEIRRVANKSQLWSRAVLDIEVAYDTDLRRAEGIIQRVADDLWNDEGFTDADILDPPQVWGIERLGADGVAIRLAVRTDPAEQWIVARELRLRIKEALDEAGIEIPFPQRTVWIRRDSPVPRSKRPVVDLATPRHPESKDNLVDNP